jgi:hypothetical protein
MALAGLDLAPLGLALALMRLLAAPAMVPLSLPALVVDLFLGAALVLATRRWEEMRNIRLIHALIIAGVALLLIKGGLGAGYGPLSGWRALLDALLGQSDARFGNAYLVLVLALIAGWRGTLLLQPTAPSEVQQRFKRGLLVMIALLVAAVLLPLSDPSATRRAAGLAAIEYVAAGLLAQALFRETSAERSDTRLSGRKLLMLLTMIGLPLALALILASWISADAAALIARVYTFIVQIVLVLITPIVAGLFAILESLIHLIRGAHPPAPTPLLPTPGPLPTLPESPPAEPLALPVWLTTLMALLPVLVPVAILALLLMLRGRRTRPETGADEERESVWSWQTAGRDFQSWWQRFQRQLARGEGDALAAALARLRGDDPATVIRRVYVRLLLRGEQMHHPRSPDQTPAEYARTLAQQLDRGDDALQIITRSYERARYDPAATTAADASAAVAAWEQLAAVPLQRQDGDVGNAERGRVD